MTLNEGMQGQHVTDTAYRTIIERLRAGIAENRLPHAFIVVGGNDGDRMGFAKEFAKTLFAADERTACRIDDDNCEDLIILRKDGNVVTVKQVEELSADMKNKPYREDRIMAVVADGDFMPENSCNKLLKTLEEPNPGNVILILTSNPQRLCDTVRSRCVTLKLPQSFPRVSADVRADAKAVLSASIFGRKPIVEAFDRIEPYCAESSDAKELLSAMALFLRDLAVGAYAEQLIAEEENRPIIAEMRKRKHFCATRLIPLIEETRADVERGMNRKHCMRSMVIRFRQEARHG